MQTDINVDGLNDSGLRFLIAMIATAHVNREADNRAQRAQRAQEACQQQTVDAQYQAVDIYA